ncbi:MAG: serine O-acetyltransferase [Thermoleophilia bacterium]|nr:serine O-acetyltransferase [Thermoleophilia bacterium]
MKASVRRDLEAARERDPAARSTAELVLTYPGLHAVWLHRVAHGLNTRGLRLPARIVSQISRCLTGIEIHPGATIGPGFFIDHGMGVVIGETTEIGEDVTLYQGVTLGGTGKHGGKRHPTLHDGVTVGAGASVLGPLDVGEGAKIGAGSIVVKDVPANSTVVGNPGKPVIVDGQRVDDYAIHHPDLEHTRLPDPVADALDCLISRVESLEAEIAALRAGVGPPPKGVDDDCSDGVKESIRAGRTRSEDAG